jgi:tetratricopeptide (TPR) repeat protein
LIEEAYKQALRASIGVLPTAANPQKSEELLANTKTLMQKLKQAASADASGAKRLISIYYGMARDLQQQLKDTTDAGKRKLLAEGFNAFLGEVATEATDFSMLNWVAEASAALGESLSSEGKVSEEAKAYIAKACTTYEQILAKSRADSSFLDPKYQVTISLRLAIARRNMQDFEKAINIFREVLEKENSKLNIQVEAAKTYQMWAEEPGNDKYFDLAVKGEYPDNKTGRNVIWGWITLSKVTSRYPQYRDVFHEARYNLAMCHFKSALRKRGTNEREQYLKFAKSDIVQTQQLYPELGGSEWRAKYDQLFRQIQKELKEPVKGLPESPAAGVSSR